MNEQEYQLDVSRLLPRSSREYSMERLSPPDRFEARPEHRDSRGFPGEYLDKETILS